MKDFLTPVEIERIEQAIKDTELITSAEIVVCIKTRSCCDLLGNDPSDADRIEAVQKAAEEKLREVCLGKTKEQNGVVILISPEDRKLAVCGDSAVSNTIDNWPMVTLKIIAGIRDDDPMRGIIDAIQIIGHRLKKRFPIQPDDINEIPNRVIVE